MNKKKNMSALDAIRLGAERGYDHADSRVVARRRDVLMFELAADDEHLLWLQASMNEVMARRARLLAKVDGRERVLNKRS